MEREGSGDSARTPGKQGSEPQCDAPVGMRDAPVGEATDALRWRLRQALMDNEDLRFDCSRLRASVAEKQAEVMALSHQNATLLRQLQTVRGRTWWQVERRLRKLARQLLKLLGCAVLLMSDAGAELFAALFSQIEGYLA